MYLPFPLAEKRWIFFVLAFIFFLSLLIPKTAFACGTVNGSWCGKRHTKAWNKEAIANQAWKRGYNGTERAQMLWLADKETGGTFNNLAVGGSHVGLFQQRFSNVSKSRWANPRVATDKAVTYIESRYGSPANAVKHWKRYGWF